MKKLFLLGLCTLFFIGCQQAETRYTTKSSEIDVTKALLKDYSEGNWEAWAGHYADTAKISHNTLETSTTSETLEGFKILISNTSEYGFSDKNIFYEMVIDDDKERWVNFWGTWEGTLAANGQKLVIPVHLTLQFVDNKIVEEHGYYNVAEYTAALAKIAMEEAMVEEIIEED
ncbi:nuclear transport factor 2 family protein [Eudoraea sp.]|uniref:nuclear transport factor 2 family protein n=1 Tax=Eudoraea sp. TaxID=1979955 RepID=UPI003C70B0E9